MDVRKTLACLLAGACGGRAIMDQPEDQAVAGAGGYGSSKGYVPSGLDSFAGTVGIVGTTGGTFSSGGIASVGGSPPTLSHCDSLPPVRLPLVVTDHYVASGYYETSWQELTPSASPCADRPDGAVGQCLGFSWTPISLTWVGLLFQYPANNWDGPGLCIEQGANQISFYARGELGGETVDFGALGIALSTVLSTSWTRYTIDLQGIDYNDYFAAADGVRGAFSIVLTRGEDDLAPKTVYVDDVRWLKSEVAAGGAGGAGGMAGMGGAEESAGGAGAGGVGGV